MSATAPAPPDLFSRKTLEQVPTCPFFAAFCRPRVVLSFLQKQFEVRPVTMACQPLTQHPMQDDTPFSRIHALIIATGILIAQLIASKPF
jgi:hypothetical protein